MIESSLNTENCEFCKKLTSNQVRNWYDFNILFESQEFVAVPALGSLVPGYLLVVSRKHRCSMAQLAFKDIIELTHFCNELSKLLSKYWKRSIIFEHGACSTANPAGSCIDHAHWHILPYDDDFLSLNFPVTESTSFYEIAKRLSLNKAYLFLKTHDNRYLYTNNTDVPNQFFRRLIAQRLGCPDEWDYLVYPKIENIKETINLLNRHGKNLSK